MTMLNFEDQLRAVVEELKKSVDSHEQDMSDRIERLETKVDDLAGELSEMKKLVESIYNLVDRIDDRVRW